MADKTADLLKKLALGAWMFSASATVASLGCSSRRDTQVSCATS